ncbi:MAG: hypothetical protein H0S85_15030 [Desulfovibrionaceae bacterium]|jgi:hypothetical protein|nr:hypothetical protein [Desulfovibrionaceae bacterium]
MKLAIELTGNMDQVVVTALPKSFIAKVFRHCMGKNNTPYFANNCFKGVLYFDGDLAAKFAEAVGYTWKGWREENRFYQGQGYCFDNDLELAVRTDGAKVGDLTASALATTINKCAGDPLLQQIGDDEAIVLLGSVDKGSETYELDDAGAAFDPALLNVAVEDFEDFYLDDRLVTGMVYDGKPMRRIPGEHRGMRMITPVLLSKNGRELDLYDFLG